jgi:predicted nucleotidyltransferase
MNDQRLTQMRQQYRQDLETALDVIVDRLSEMPEVVQAILFGSYAAGRRDLFTDIDLIVVMETGKNWPERSAELYQNLQTGVDLDLLVYTPEEFEVKRQGAFLGKALENGRVIYEKKRV